VIATELTLSSLLTRSAGGPRATSQRSAKNTRDFHRRWRSVRLRLFRDDDYGDPRLVFLTVVLSFIPHAMMYGPHEDARWNAEQRVVEFGSKSANTAA
jgi:hypothetical protein